MNDSLASIRSAIETRLDAATKLQDVVLGKGMAFSGFPACRFFLSDAPQELKDNAPTYLRSYIFTIEIIQEITQKTTAVAEADFQDAIEQVLNGLSTNWTLGDNVDISDIQSSPIAEVEYPFGPCVVASITFAAKTLIS
jgi:hypothetical protein